MPLPSSSYWNSLFAWLLLACVLVFAAWLRLHDFDESLWLDELHTAWCVGGSFGEVAPRAMIGNQPPLPYWLLWGWVQLAGISEWSLRGPSLVASLAAIVAVFIALRRWTGSHAAGLVAALALTVEPNSIFYGGEARVYAWVELLAVVHVMLFVEILTRTPLPKLWVGVHAAWIIVGALLFYAHYTTALLLAGEVLLGASLTCCARLTTKRKALLLDGAVLAVLCLPALAQLRAIAARRGNWELFVDRPTLLDLWEAIPVLPTLVATALLVAFVLGIRYLMKLRPLWRPREPEIGMVIGCWLSVPLLLAWLLSFTDVARLFHVRYYFVALPAMACLLGWLVALLPTAKLRSAALPIVFVFLLTQGHFFTDYVTDTQQRPRRNEGWREAVTWINSDSASNEILLVSGLIEADALRTSDDPQLRAYCSFPLRSAYPITRPVTIESLPMTQPWRLSDDQVRAYENPHVILVIRGGAKYRQEVCAKLLEAMIHPRYHIFAEASFGDVGVYRLTVWPWSAAYILGPDTKAKLRRIFPDDPDYRPSLLDKGLEFVKPQLLDADAER